MVEGERVTDTCEAEIMELWKLSTVDIETSTSSVDEDTTVETNTHPKFITTVKADVKEADVTAAISEDTSVDAEEITPEEISTDKNIPVEASEITTGVIDSQNETVEPEDSEPESAASDRNNASTLMFPLTSLAAFLLYHIML